VRAAPGAPAAAPRAALAALALAAAALPARSAAGDLDAELYAGILLRHTREVADAAGVRVDYRGLAGAPEWTSLVARLAASDPERLGEGSVGHRERLAFWINAYNILAIDLVVRHPDVGSIREIGSLLRPVWGREAGQVGGRGRSLGEIEHEILRPLGDPRIHAAIVCASVSCPPLRREPFAAARLDEQLDDQMRRWLASPEKGLRVDAAAGTVHLSRVFDWFAADFEAGGGALAFAARFAPAVAARFLAERGADVRVRYLPYDWDLNALGP
jgi:hypothetical protein